MTPCTHRPDNAACASSGGDGLMVRDGLIHVADCRDERDNIARDATDW
jgi:hypothetical protein